LKPSEEEEEEEEVVDLIQEKLEGLVNSSNSSPMDSPAVQHTPIASPLSLSPSVPSIPLGATLNLPFVMNNAFPLIPLDHQRAMREMLKKHLLREEWIGDVCLAHYKETCSYTFLHTVDIR
jgi:hypothetical protein